MEHGMDKVITFEVAISILSGMMGLISQELLREQAKSHPDLSKLAALKREHSKIWRERHFLGVEDEVVINHVLAEYGPLVKEGMETLVIGH